MLSSIPCTSKNSSKYSPWQFKKYSTDGQLIPLQKNWLESRCTLPQDFDEILPKILEFKVRQDDLFVVTFIKSGTTMMQEIAWLLTHNLDFETSKKLHLMQRTVFIDYDGFRPTAASSLEFSESLASPRVIKSHMPPNLLPRQIWKNQQKIVYVARNCKDVIVSAYHYIKDLGLWLGDDINEFVKDFINDEIFYTNYWSHVVDFWKMRNEPYIFFVTYEEILRNQAEVIRNLCVFLNRPQLSEEDMQKMLEHLSFDKMKTNKQINLTQFFKDEIPSARDHFEFMRRGIIGSFRDELTPDLQQAIDDWSQQCLAPHNLAEKDIIGNF